MNNENSVIVDVVIGKIESWPILPTLEPNAREWIKRLVIYLKTTDVVETCDAYKGEEYREWLGDKSEVGCTLPKRT